MLSFVQLNCQDNQTDWKFITNFPGDMWIFLSFILNNADRGDDDEDDVSVWSDGLGISHVTIRQPVNIEFIHI